MPADLVPHAAIPELAAHVTPEMLQVLEEVQQAGFVQNGSSLSSDKAEILRQLASLGLVDPGYSGSTDGPPFIWISNGNGARVLRHILESKIEINPRARTALDALPRSEQQAVLF